MATTNPVSQVLVTSGNQHILAAGSRVTDLKHGQLGVFNLHTGLSIDGSDAFQNKDVFIAVGINRTTLNPGDAAEDIAQSAGQVIQSKRLRALTVKPYQAEVPQIVEVTGFQAKADTSYGLKIEFTSPAIMMLNGYNLFAKTFNAQTSANLDDTDPTGNNGELAEQLINNINADPDHLVTASAFAYQIQTTIGAGASANGNLTVSLGIETFIVPVVNGDSAATVAAKIAAAINASATTGYTASNVGALLSFYPKVSVGTGVSTDTVALGAGGTSVTFTGITAAVAAINDTVAFRTANPKSGFGIKITGNPELRPSAANDINIKYHKTGSTFNVSLPYGFEGVFSVTKTQDLKTLEGSGYDIKQLEYIAGGWNGKPGPYRVSETTNMPIGGFEYFANINSRYTQIALAYDQKSVGGWLEYENNLETLIAVPCADANTVGDVITILNGIFGAEVDIAGQADCSSTSVTSALTENEYMETLS